jgi:hypothetical protein
VENAIMDVSEIMDASFGLNQPSLGKRHLFNAIGNRRSRGMLFRDKTDVTGPRTGGR